MVQNVKKFCLYGTHLENDNIFSCFFHFFKSLIFRVVRGVKGQKMVQIDKKFCPLRSVFQELYIIWLLFMTQGVKGQKTVQNGKKFCPSRSISRGPCILWLSFMVHICKMIIYPGVFVFFLHFFNILIFLDHRGLKGKKRFRMTKHSVCHAPYLRNHTSYDLQLWYTCMFKRIKSPDIFSFCFKILAFLIISLVHVWNEISLANFLIFQNFDFWGF